jgi:hypothetical protein
MTLILGAMGCTGPEEEVISHLSQTQIKPNPLSTGEQNSSNILGGGGSTGVCTQGFALARQMFSRLSHNSGFFNLVILELESLFLPRPAWTVILLSSTFCL